VYTALKCIYGAKIIN